MNETHARYSSHPATTPNAMNDITGTSRNTDTNGDAAVEPHAFGKFSATMPNGAITRICPTILRQPDRPRLRWRRNFM